MSHFKDLEKLDFPLIDTTIVNYVFFLIEVLNIHNLKNESGGFPSTLSFVICVCGYMFLTQNFGITKVGF